MGEAKYASSGEDMACNSCGSLKQEKFRSEIDIHFPGLKNVDKRPVVVFPELVVCLNCGKAEFTVAEDDLNLLAEGNATKGSRAPAIFGMGKGKP
jgi:hypothetical protein